MSRVFFLLLISGAAWASTGASIETSVGTILPTVLLSIALLVMSAFFSSSETALFSLQPVELESMSGRGEQEVRRLLDSPRQTLASILIGNETINIALSTVTAGLLLRMFPNQPWLNIIIVAPILLIFGEVIPKTLAFRFARHLAPRAAPILWHFARLTTPIRFILSRLADAALVITGGSRAPRQAELREAHLRELIDRGRQSGNIRPVEQEILHRVFEFGDLSVGQLMTPRSQTFSINLQTPWPELIRSLQESGHSRVPVWQGAPNNIVGILLVKRLLALVATQRTHGDNRNPNPRQIHKMLHAPRFVSSTKAADDLLSEFQARRSHMAIVVNELGNMVGVITLDDLLNELVGEMFDETDKEDPAVTAIEGQSWQVEGSMPSADFSNRFHLIIPDGTYDTLGEFVQSISESPTSMGLCIEWSGVRFTIDELIGTDISLVTVELEQAYDGDEPTQESLPLSEEPA